MIELDELIHVPECVASIRPGVYRVVFVAPREDLAALYWLGAGEPGKAMKPVSHKRKPRVVELSHMKQLAEAKLIQRVPDDPPEGPNNRFRWAQMDTPKFERNKLILQCLTGPATQFSMLVSGAWDRHMKEAAANYKVSEQMASRLLHRYYRLRRDIDAASEDRRWIKGKKRVVMQKLGRKHKRDEAGHRPDEGRNATLDDEACIKVFYQSLENQSASKASMFRDFEAKFAPCVATTTADGKLTRKTDPSVPFINVRQFRYALQQVVGDLKLLENAAGERRVNLGHRVATGSARDRVEYPGQYYIIDATVADVYLISAFDRRMIIGRPVLYVVIDAFSSLIVGVHVALEGPSFAQARIAMYRAVADKSPWLNWLGVPHIDHLLPQGCVPSFWLADRGELHCEESRALQLELGTNLSLAASYRADWKSIVERNFGTLNELCIHWVPGSVQNRIKERGTRDTRLDAVFTLQEFTRLMLREAALLNLTRDMSKHLSGSMVATSVVANPLGFWHWGVTHRHGSPTYLSQEVAIRKMLVHESANVTRHGLMCGERKYVAEWMKDHEQFRLAGFRPVSPAKLVKSPDVPTLAWCQMPLETQMLEVILPSQYGISGECSTEDVIELETIRSFTGQDLKDDTRGTRIDLYRENKQEEQDAKEKTEAAIAAAPMSKSARTRGISANRKAEVEASQMPAAQLPERAADPDQFSVPSAEATTSVANSNDSEDEYFQRLLSQVRGWGAP